MFYNFLHYTLPFEIICDESKQKIVWCSIQQILLCGRHFHIQTSGRFGIIFANVPLHFCNMIFIWLKTPSAWMDHPCYYYTFPLGQFVSRRKFFSMRCVCWGYCCYVILLFFYTWNTRWILLYSKVTKTQFENKDKETSVLSTHFHSTERSCKFF